MVAADAGSRRRCRASGGASMRPQSVSRPANTNTGVMIGRRPSVATRNPSRIAVSRSQKIAVTHQHEQRGGANGPLASGWHDREAARRRRGVEAPRDTRPTAPGTTRPSPTRSRSAGPGSTRPADGASRVPVQAASARAAHASMPRGRRRPAAARTTGPGARTTGGRPRAPSRSAHVASVIDAKRGRYADRRPDGRQQPAQQAGHARPPRP